MDPFTGLGSTAAACARLGLNFVGAEIDETYLKEAVVRVRDTTHARMQKASSKATSSLTKRVRERA